MSRAYRKKIAIFRLLTAYSVFNEESLTMLYSLGRLSFALLFVVCATSPFAVADDWVDHFYQFRLPVEIESAEAGWHVVPLDAEQITAAINRLSPFRFDPNYLAFNQVKLVEVNALGEVLDGEVEGGFTLVRQGPELAEQVLSGVEEKKTIEVTPDRYHLLRFTNSGGGKCPALAYEPIHPPDSPLRRALYRISYFAPLLPQSKTTHEVLFVPDGTAMELLVRGRFIGTLHDLRVQAAEIRLLAKTKRPGIHRYHLYYQPLGSHHLQIPSRRRDQVPSDVAVVRSVGAAVEYTGETQYRVGDAAGVQAWFAESTVKMTPRRQPPRQVRPQIRIAAAANESQSFQLVLTPQQSTTLEAVTLTDLTSGEKGHALGRAQVKLVEYVPIKTSSYLTPARLEGKVGDPLLPLVPPVKLTPEGGNRALWITLQVPGNTPAGLYRGTLQVTFQEGGLDLPVELEVFDFELPEFASFKSDMGGQYIVKQLNHLNESPRPVMDYHGISSKPDILKLARGYFDQMAAAKFYPKSATLLTEIGMNWTPPPAGFNVDRPDNFITLKDWDFKQFNAELEYFINQRKVNSLCLFHTNPTACNQFNHLPGNPLERPALSSPHTTMGWQAWRKMTLVAYDKPPSNKTAIEITRDQFDNVMLQFFRRTAEELDKHGWLDRVHVLIDETENPRRLAHFLKLLKSDPLTARIQVVACMQGLGLMDPEHPGNEGLREFPFPELIDTYCPEIDENYDRWMPYYFADYQIPRDRRKLWCYIVATSRIAIDTPGINNRVLALDVFQRGGSGALLWESFGWDHPYGDSMDPWEDPYTPHGNGSLAFFYPPRRSSDAKTADFTITPSLRLAAFRESVDDFEYARMLEDLVRVARRQAVPAQDAEQTLADIQRFFPENTNWSQNAAWFLELRERLARQIVALRQQLTQ